MKNHKQLICGILIGAVATLSITALAEYVINPNPYPVKVNGQTVQIEGYNINDSTYFKLRDISAVVGGLTVDFKDGAVTIDTAASTPAPTPTPAPVANKNLAPLPDVPIHTVDDVDYVQKSDIEIMLNGIGLNDYGFWASTDFKNLSDPLNNPALLENIPLCPTNQLLIPYNYYISTVVPLINSLR